MKKINLIMWVVVIMGSVYIISKIVGTVDVKNIDSPLAKTLIATSSKFYFDGTEYNSSSLPPTFVSTNILGKVFFLKTVSTESDRTKGLSGVDAMSDNVGMLFAFEQDGTYGFWMKDMKFPLDIVWIDSSKVVVDISERISPESYPKTINPSVPIRYVLELNAGIVEKIGLKKGDRVSF